MFNRAHKHVDKVWGWEKWIVNTPEYCGKLLFLRKGWQCSLHYHKLKDETFFMLSGNMRVELDGQVGIMGPADSIRVRPLQKHRFGGIQDSLFIEFSTHHEDDDSYRETKSGPMTLLAKIQNLTGFFRGTLRCNLYPDLTKLSDLVKALEEFGCGLEE